MYSYSTRQPAVLGANETQENAEAQWSTDIIPDFLNIIRRQTDMEKLAAEQCCAVGTVAVSVAAPPPPNLWAKLQEVRLKNPVSGLMEYAQFLGQNCEFLLLDQSGPSHDPRSVICWNPHLPPPRSQTGFFLSFCSYTNNSDVIL